MIKKLLCLGVLIAGSLLCGCSSYRVFPIPYNPGFQTVSIEHNPRVMVSDFEPIMMEAFASYGIKPRIVPYGYRPAQDEFLVTYSARRSFDFVPYLSWARLSVVQNSTLVGTGEYRHIGGSWSLAPSKFRSTKYKMSRLYNELLMLYKKRRESN